MPVIHVELSLDSIERAIEEVKAYQKKVKSLGNNVVKRLATDGAENAKELASFMNAVDTGELVGSISGKAKGNTGYVLANCEHAAFVEFGTGVKGLRAQHPSPISGWEYDRNGHGDAGWYYFKNGQKHWTKGVESRPYMYDTAQMMAQAVPEIVAEELQS